MVQTSERPSFLWWLRWHLTEYRRYSHLLQNLVAREVKVRYRRSALGVLWTLLNPLMMMAIFTIVFSTLFARSLQNFPIYFLSAHLSWHFFAQTTSMAMTSMIRSASLYKRIYVPKQIFVFAIVLSDMVNFGFSLVPLALLMLLLRQSLSGALLFLPVSFLVLFMVTTGVSFFVATVAVFFDDITQFYQIILQAVMYLTALFYPISIVPPTWQLLIRANPMYHVIALVRYPIYYGQIPPLESIIVSSLAAIIALVVGLLVFDRNSDRFIYYI